MHRLSWTLSSANIPHHCTPAGAKYGWRLAWETMMKELAPQTTDGSYARPTYNLKGVIGSPEFPVSPLSPYHHDCAR